MPAVRPPQDLDRTIPVALALPAAPAANPVVSPSLLRLYLAVGAGAMLAAALSIVAERHAHPMALHVATLYFGFVAVSAAALLMPRRWQQRFGLPVLLVLVVASVAASGYGAWMRNWGLAAPSLLLLPLLVFAMSALVGWRAGAALALWVVLVMGVAQAFGGSPTTPVPWTLLASGHAVALLVAVLAGGALNRRIRRATATAAQREQRFRRLLALATDVYWEIDAELQLVSAGRHEQDLRAAGIAALVGRRWDELPALDMDSSARRLLAECSAARRPFRDVAVAWRHRDGVLRHYRLSGEPRLAEDGQFKGYWGVARDVSHIEATRAALADSRARYEALFRHAPLPLVLHVGGHIVDANPAAAQVLSLGAVSELIGRPLNELIAGEQDRQLSVQRLARLEGLPAGTPLPMTQLRLRAAGGTVAVSVTAVRIELQGERAVLSMFIDLTERLRAEEALRRSQTTLVNLIDSSPDLITLTDLASGRYHLVNRSFERMSGWLKTEAEGRTSLELNIWGSERAREDFVRRVQQGQDIADLPIPFRRRDGSVVTLLIAAARFTLEGREMLVLNGRDVSESERDRMERAAILDNAGIGIAVTRDRRFVLANAEFERMIGWSGGSLLGQPGTVVWKSEADYAEVGRLIGPRLARGEKVEIEREVQRRDGSTFLARLRAGVVDSARPSDGGTVWIVEDITERAQFESALARARDDAEAASRAKSAFLANTSHELRTPLNGLLGLARLARDVSVPQAQRQQYLAQIEDSAQSLAAIISDILDLSKIEAGRLGLDLAPFDLSELLQSLARTWRTLAEAKGLQLSLHLDPGLGELVLGDALRLRQIVTNFVGNAIKFTDSGFVRLSAHRVVVAGDARRVRIECEDTGPGIRHETQAALFEPFTQADQSTTRRFGGTGLGLSICRELATLMGGQVGVASQWGVGSRFWAEVELPRHGAAPVAASAATAEPPARTDPAALRGMRVLMVEDNPVNMLIGVAMLERWGVEVTQARDGSEALAALDVAAAPFDAVLMDVQMPGMGGHETTRELRARPAGRTLPVIALTAAALVSEREQALASGMDDFLTKPIDADKLLTTLARWRQGRSAGAPGDRDLPPAPEPFASC